MFSLFNDPTEDQEELLDVSGFSYLKTAHQENLSRVISHYRRNTHYSSSNHLLIQLLQHLPISQRDELTVFRDKAADLTGEIGRALDLTTVSHIGETRSPGVFYGEGSEEIILLTNDAFSLEDLRLKWEDAEPVRFLRHPKTDLSANVPDGVQTSPETGLSVITINYPMLACQYRQWMWRQLKLPEEDRQSINDFVRSYPITNALRSQLDVAFVNRSMRLFFGEPVADTGDTHPFYFNARHEKTDSVIMRLLDLADRKRVTVEEFVNAWPVLYRDNMRQTIAAPNVLPTRQVTWSLVSFRLPYIGFLLQRQAAVGGRQDRQVNNRIKRSIRRLRSDRSIDQLASSELSDQLTTYIQSNIEPFV